MEINFYLTEKSASGEQILDFLMNECKYPSNYANYLVNNVYENFIADLREDLVFAIEYPYVDKFYRDCYYNYYSSKLEYYTRFSLKIGIFEPGIHPDDFASAVGKKKLQENFLGFFTVRPTHPKIMGRNVLSPNAFKGTHVNCCYSHFDITVFNVKLRAKGFPHASQDGETITCAETTLWSCMEYFSHKYPEYQPLQPSRIVELLKNHTFERQLPSKGLNILQLSAALKHIGFGSIIYSAQDYGVQFEALLGCYVESGIPVILALQNGKKINHASLAIGRESITPELIDSCPVALIQNSITIKDLNNAKCKYIFIDDNLPPYQRGLYDSPCDYYNNHEWQLCKIEHFIVPLYKRIYLEAYQAKMFVNSLLLETSYFNIPAGAEIFIRCLLASSRSFKEKVAFDASMHPYMKQLITATALPKFIWVAELSTAVLAKAAKANGLILIDATEANTKYLNPLILGFFNNIFLTFAPEKRDFDKNYLSFGEFNAYTNNLGVF